ncbi:hypothetical protein V1527DRAFT_242992 [Lipomyces starkeyi]
MLIILATLISVCFGASNSTNLTDSQALFNFLECVEACSKSYNYTLQQSGELIGQPAQIRELDFSLNGTDFQLSYCINTIGARFWIVISSNTMYEDDLQGRMPLDRSAYNTLSMRELLLRVNIPGNRPNSNGNVTVVNKLKYIVL